MIPAMAYFMANRVLENETWKNNLKNIHDKSKIMKKAKGYVVAMARELGIKLNELEIRESAGEIMIRIIKEI